MIQGLSMQTDDIQYICSQVLQGMMASQETTAVLIANTIFMLSRYPKYWHELRTQVIAKGDTIYTFDNLTAFVFLQNVLNECRFDR